eukprot:TRINITY_DN1359_c0_g1_i1.p1 TRINITY_DN1359_c0_g1~~TRINITY_DN1359_c0_g1_i1.p1  ORF type:complete len:535 (+),score=93.88 TRINITY_DN1359_c0_g1_i1:146-1750(+)
MLQFARLNVKTVLLHKSFASSAKSTHEVLEDVAKRLNVKHWEDWYQVRSSYIESLGHNYPQFYYGESPVKAVLEAYPQYPWKIWNFKFLPVGYYHERANQVAFFQDAAKVFNISELDDWYRVRTRDIEAHGGTDFLNTFGKPRRLIKALRALYPSKDWKPWLFKDGTVGSGYWKDKNEQRYFMDYLGQQFGFKTPDDYLQLNASDFSSHGGAALLSHFGGSLTSLLKAVYPDHKWASEAPKKEEGHWKSLEVQRKFLDDLAKKLKIERLEDWYRVKNSDIEENGGYGLLNMHNRSASQAIMSVYPHDWKPWKFANRPRDYWEDERHVRDYLAWFEKEVGITSMEDWYGISGVMYALHGRRLLERYGGLPPLLLKFFPDYPWDVTKFGSSSHFSKPHAMLLKRLLEIFPAQTEILINYIHPQLIDPKQKNFRMELDIFLPDYDLAFEYQGAHHYKETMFGDLEEYQKRDQAKREACEKIGLTLIAIPYWWDCATETLQATIFKYRPDLVSFNGSTPLSETKQNKRQKKSTEANMS